MTFNSATVTKKLLCHLRRGTQPCNVAYFIAVLADHQFARFGSVPFPEAPATERRERKLSKRRRVRVKVRGRVRVRLVETVDTLPDSGNGR